MPKTEMLLAEFPKAWTLEDGTRVTVRAMVKEDRDPVARFERNVIDPAGTYHDLVVLNLDLA
jgi:hypothetical protein